MIVVVFSGISMHLSFILLEIMLLYLLKEVKKLMEI